LHPDQIIIVDASENTATRDVAAEFSGLENLEYYHTEKGLTRQRNFGLTKATGEIIGFFDDDVVLDNDYLEKMIAVFDNDKPQKIGGATGYVYTNVLKVSFLLRCFYKIKDLVGSENRLMKYYEMTPMPAKPFKEIIPLRFVSGCNMFFRKEVFNEFVFDPLFEGYGLGEDKDFGLRVSKKWKIVGVGPARLYHLFEPAGRPNLRKLGKMMFVNHLRMLVLARNDKIIINALLLSIRQFVAVLLECFKYLIAGRMIEGFGFLRGACEGILAGTQYVMNHRREKNEK